MQKSTGNYTRPLRRREKSPNLPGSQKTAMGLMLFVGILMGLSADRMANSVFGKATFDIKRLALQAHEVYSAQEIRPIELEAIDQILIENWFSKSVKRGFKVPDLSKFGLEFVGARLSVAEGKAAAYLLYIDDDDKNLAYYLTRSKSDNDDSESTDKINKFNLSIWHKDGFGYVLIGLSLIHI